MSSARFLVLAALAMVLAACTNSGSSLQQMIPADALGVVSLNVPEMLKKSGITTDDGMSVPQDIQAIIDENDQNILAQILTELPYLGLDTDSRAFIFFTNKTFARVLLVALDDERAARQTIARKTGADFSQADGLDCVYREDNLYAIKDKVLLIAAVNKPMEMSRAATAARAILDKQRQNITENELAKNALNADGDINVYLQQDGLRMLLSRSKTYRQVAQRLPLLGIFTESDIRAYEAHVSLDEGEANLSAHIIADEGSDYNKLLDMTLADPDPGFLKAMPNSMDCIMTVSVKGDRFVKLKQIQQLLQMFGNLPFIGRIDLGKILASIDGPIAVGLARDPHLEGEWNAVIAAKTSDHDMVLNQVSAFATSMGQAPEIYDNEYVYQYENKMIKMGVVDGVVYLKMLDYEQTEGYAHDMEELRETFSRCNVGCYVNPQLQQGGTFVFGMTDHFNGTGRFVPAQAGDHPARALLKALCAVKPAQAYDDMLDDDILAPAPGAAIDNLRPMN